MKLTIFISVLQVLVGLATIEAQDDLYLPQECVPTNLRQVIADMSSLSNQVDGIIDDVEGIYNGFLADNSIEADSTTSTSLSILLNDLRSANSDVRGCQADINADVGLRRDRQLSLERELEAGNLPRFLQFTQLTLEKLSHTLCNLFDLTRVLCDAIGRFCPRELLAVIGIGILIAKETVQSIKFVFDFIDIAVGPPSSGSRGGGKSGKGSRRGRLN